MDFFLKCFYFLSEEVRLVYFWYFCNFFCFLSIFEKENEKIEKMELFEDLKKVEVILVKDGMWKMVFNFYNFNNDVFCVMLLEDKFFLILFDVDEWLLFLKKVGLIEDVF